MLVLWKLKNCWAIQDWKSGLNLAGLETTAAWRNDPWDGQWVYLRFYETKSFGVCRNLPLSPQLSQLLPLQWNLALSEPDHNVTAAFGKYSCFPESVLPFRSPLIKHLYSATLFLPISLYLQSYYLHFLSLPCYSTAVQLRKGWDKARPRASSYSFKASTNKNKDHTNTWSIYINRYIAHSYKCGKYSQSAQRLLFVLSTLFYHNVL